MDEPKIPTVEEAQAKVDALKAEQRTLAADVKAMEARIKAANERLNKIDDWNRRGELHRALQALHEANLATQWDALTVTVKYLPLYSNTPAEGRLLKMTAKQIHVLTTRGKDYVSIFSRETGRAGKGGKHDPCILNLSEVLATVAQS